ncbi:polyphosphate kinase 1 [Sphingobacterium phlebotomi]|uniref:Polyphosphate kinase n=1 Tax=Sphingobacterium phlebotomi TaxID=2605433 RepID=A0A5D4H7D4_9SPHI|nr:polyphosphate kinase 1 [Sphingobacterium phlebotomi]TYR36517.1 polyphosphate kinase 1 [Sphingobacterium phlebotomi]
MINRFIPRDISWLSFNGRVLQEAADESVPLSERIKFLGIFSNNLDEFFRVRVAGLKRALIFNEKEAREIFFEKPQVILDQLNELVIQQQQQFDHIWLKVQADMAKEKVFIKTDEELNHEQQEFVKFYYEEEVESNVIPLMLDEARPMPYLRDKSLYLGIAMRKKDWEYETRFAIIENPTRHNGRFLLLPSPKGEKHVMLLEDVIKYNLPHIFSYFGFDSFTANAFKITKDAEFDIDNDINTTLVEKIEKGIKNRRKGKPTRFVFDKDMDSALVAFLIKKLNLSKKDSIIPGQKIHNFKHFMDFPKVFKSEKPSTERSAFDHPDFAGRQRISDVLVKKDVLLSFPYHTFHPIIDLLREAAMDPDVRSIYITIYRMAENSKVANTLINAARNGKEVTVMLELRARFDEEHNLMWKERFEMEGVKVLLGIPDKKVHAKLCVIKKRLNNKTIQYGFVSTGNFNEKTAKIYGDHCFMTSNRTVMADINKIFTALKKPKGDLLQTLKPTKNLLVCPTNMRTTFLSLIDKEIAEARAGNKARIIIKINSLSDKILIRQLYEAAAKGVKIELIVRGIYCAVNQKKFKVPFHAISIIDEYLEHARAMYFYAGGKELVYISSADWMPRNLDFRVEAAVQITNKKIKQELIEMLEIQLKDNVKARILNNKLDNTYVHNDKSPYRSQVELYQYLRKKTK